MSLRKESIFINGIFKEVVDEILETHLYYPSYPLYLQPYSPYKISRLFKNPPTIMIEFVYFYQLKNTEQVFHIAVK